MERVRTASPPHAAARHNLPAERTSLIGRERERGALAGVLATARLATLTGIGGGGKTRLALAVAADLIPQFSDGVWFVELAALAEPALLPAALAAALDLRHAQDAEPLAALLAFLRPRALLLVLDNCEHLIHACAALAAAILAGCPDVRILATSREPLRVAGERQYRLAPLAAPDPDALPPFSALAAVPAVRLFVDRARAVDAAFRLTPENAAAVAGICARLDGIPLALELAAARVGALGPGQILERLHDSVRLLTGGDRAGPTRQQTLRAALAWGDALLDPAERALFRRLAVFAGGWDLAAAEAVGVGADVAGPDVLDLLAGLVDKSLVQADVGAQAARYRLLEPVRQYAGGLLDAAGEREGARARHAAHFLALAEAVEPALHGPDQLCARARLTDEMGNLRTALVWAAERAARGDPAPGLRLATVLVPFWEVRNALIEGRGRLAAALAAAPDGTVDARLRVRALLGAGRLAFRLVDYPAATAHLAEALAGARALGDPGLIAAVLVELGGVRGFERDFAGAARHLREGLAGFRALGDRAGTALALFNLGAAARFAGESARAVALLAESLALFEAAGDLRFIALARALLGMATAQGGDHAAGAAHLAAALAAHPDRDDHGFLVWHLLGLAEALFAQGRRGEAARFLGAAEAHGDRAGLHLAALGRANAAPFFAAAEAGLAEPAFAAAWAEGRTFSVDRVVGYALAVVGTAPAARPVPPPPAAATLTRREHEIALLVASGRSDRQIADALSISTATASVHVHRILRKLALRSRHQVAAWSAARAEAAPPAPDPGRRAGAARAPRTTRGVHQHPRPTPKNT